MNQEDLLNAPLPERWSFRQRLKNTIIVKVVTQSFKLLRTIPINSLYKWMPGLARLAFLLASSDRNRAIAQLQQALNISETQARALTRSMFEHLGKVGMEWIHKDKLLDEHPDLQLSAEHRQLFEEALAENTGLVAITGHIGNWELLAQMVAKAGYPVVSVARPTYDPRLTRLIHQLRSTQGMKVLWRGSSSSPKDILRVFRENQILGMLIDQDTKVQSAFVPFFGKSAATPTAAATLALRKNTPIIIGWLHRTEQGFKPHFERYHYPTSGDQSADVVQITSYVTQRLEFAIREYPEQWVWLHKRWKTREKAVNEIEISSSED